ncbi:hypothetical protein Anapl_06723 [Anas platyrhynchos]|uniref:Uncharacterized protein n=1 Tax=Anas platyrhynchos TaxID=8839 RepID=R0M534_ANAPL|nr:hypothetical protein Anapl_06723 [Anas platyrhynchos]
MAVPGLQAGQQARAARSIHFSMPSVQPRSRSQTRPYTRIRMLDCKRACRDATTDHKQQHGAKGVSDDWAAPNTATVWAVLGKGWLSRLPNTMELMELMKLYPPDVEERMEVDPPLP